MTYQPAVGSISRAARVLEALSEMPDGGTLANIVSVTNFSKTTTFRILASLQDVHYVVQDPEARTYRLGSALADLARKADHVDLASLARRPMQRLAAKSEDTVFFSIMEGAASVCIARELGTYPVRTLTLDRGDRVPLGLGGSGLAMYSLLSDAKREACNKVNAKWLAEFGVAPEQLEDGRAYFHEHGYAFNHGMVYKETSAIGLPVLTSDGRLVGAIAIGAVFTRMTLDRINETLLPALREETAALSQRLGCLPEEAEQ